VVIGSYSTLFGATLVATAVLVGREQIFTTENNLTMLRKPQATKKSHGLGRKNSVRIFPNGGSFFPNGGSIFQHGGSVFPNGDAVWSNPLRICRKRPIADGVATRVAPIGGL
jgi:hypothetical protein